MDVLLRSPQVPGLVKKLSAKWYVWVCLPLVAMAIRGPLSPVITEDDYGGPWPFSVAEVRLHCASMSPGTRVWAEVDQTHYSLREHAAFREGETFFLSLNWPVGDLGDIWADPPIRGDALRPLIEHGLKFCRPAQTDVYSLRASRPEMFVEHLWWRASMWTYWGR